MHFFDIAIIILIAVFTILGVKRGLIGEIFRLAAVVGGFAAASILYKNAYASLTFITLPPSAKTAIAFLLVYIAAALTILAVGWLIRKVIHLSLLGWLDRMLGGAIGMLKAAAIVWILMMCVAIVPLSPVYQLIASSRTFQIVAAIPFKVLSPSTPGNLPLLQTVVDIDKSLGSVRDMKDKLEQFRNKVDSAKTMNDTIKKKKTGIQLMEAIMLYVPALLTGLMLGSFFNVCIWRMPRNESVVFPPSHCPSCNRPIRPWENIPVISYLLLRGKCAGCRASISAIYPIIESVTALCALLLAHTIVTRHIAQQHTAGEHIFLALQLLSLLILIPVAVIDLKHYIIPDSITLTGLVIGFLGSFIPGSISPVGSLLGILAGGGSLYVLGFIGEVLFKKGEAMGGGDIKLLAFMGAVWGWKISLIAIFAGSVLGVFATIPLLIIHRIPGDHRLPFGPFLSAGMWISVLWGEQGINAYFSLIQKIFNL